MPYNSRLKILKGEEPPRYFDLINLSTSISSPSIKADYKVIEGNRISGIEQGIGLTTAGRVLNYAIPIFETKDKPDLYKTIAEYSSLLINSYAYEFYIEHKIDNIYYSARVNINEIKGYSIDLTNHIKGFGFSAMMIDNYFSGNEVNDNIGLKGSGMQTIKYTSKSLVPAPFGFEWTIQGIDPTFSAWIVHNGNYGITMNIYFNGGTYNLNYDGTLLLINGESYLYSGVQPFLNVGENDIQINSNYNTISFIIKYKVGISL